MVFLSEQSQFLNQPKGRLKVALERGLLDGVTNQPIQKCKKCPVASHSPTTVKCCLNRILNQEPDFASEISALQKTVIKRGHKCLILRKFHCELNPIECASGDSKKNLQKRVRLLVEFIKDHGSKCTRCNFHHQDSSLVSTN